MPLIIVILLVAVFSIIINISCYCSSKSIKDKKKLRFRSKVMLTISLMTLFITILIAILVIIEINKPPVTPQLGEDASTTEIIISSFVAALANSPDLLYGILQIIVPSILVTVFLPFLITSIILRRISTRGTTPKK